MFCFEKIYTFSVGEEDFKQRFWAQPPFLSHIRFRVLGAVFVAHFGVGFYFRFIVLLAETRRLRAAVLCENRFE